MLQKQSATKPIGDVKGPAQIGEGLSGGGAPAPSKPTYGGRPAGSGNAIPNVDQLGNFLSDPQEVMLYQSSPGYQQAVGLASHGATPGAFTGKQLLGNLFEQYFKGSPHDSPYLIADKARWYLDIKKRMEGLPEINVEEASGIFNSWATESTMGLMSAMNAPRNEQMDIAFAPPPEKQDINFQDLSPQERIQDLAMGLAYKLAGGDAGQAAQLSLARLKGRRQQEDVRYQRELETDRMKRLRAVETLKGIDSVAQMQARLAETSMKEAGDLTQALIRAETTREGQQANFASAVMKGDPILIQAAAQAMRLPLTQQQIDQLARKSEAGIKKTEGEGAVLQAKAVNLWEQTQTEIAKRQPEIDAILLGNDNKRASTEFLKVKTYLAKTYGDREAEADIALKEAKKVSEVNRARKLLAEAKNVGKAKPGGSGLSADELKALNALQGYIDDEEVRTVKPLEEDVRDAEKEARFWAGRKGEESSLQEAQKTLSEAKARLEAATNHLKPFKDQREKTLRRMQNAGDMNGPINLGSGNLRIRGGG